MIGIYKITNLINGKVYIGQSTDIEKRWNQHKSDAFNATRTRYNSALYAAIRKYGLDSFSFEIIEETEVNQLNLREQYWIDYYNSFKDGYNLTLGGEGTLKTNIQQIYDLWQQGNTQKEIVQLTGLNKSTVTKWLQTMPNYSEHEVRSRSAQKANLVRKTNSVSVPSKTYKTQQELSLAHSHKLNWNIVHEIKEKLKENYSNSELSQIYNVSTKTISQINTGKSWYEEMLYPIRK